MISKQQNYMSMSKTLLVRSSSTLDKRLRTMWTPSNVSQTAAKRLEKRRRNINKRREREENANGLAESTVKTHTGRSDGSGSTREPHAHESYTDCARADAAAGGGGGDDGDGRVVGGGGGRTRSVGRSLAQTTE